jgi:hypothetical protein
MHQSSFLLGLSSNDGKNWKFVDTGQIGGGDKLRKILPECSPILTIPARPKPKLTPK